MIIIGEKINATRSSVRDALTNRKREVITSLIESQHNAGAAYIDLNAATSPEEEIAHLRWLLEIARASDLTALSLDSASSEVLKDALEISRGSDVIINSTTMEPARYKKIFPLAKEYNAKVIVLALDEDGLPRDAKKRYEIAARACTVARTFGIPPESLFIDPLVRPLATEQTQAKEVLEALGMIKKDLPAKTVFGVSNISFGLPLRSLINRTFLGLAAYEGLDAVIADPLDKQLLASIAATDVVTGKDNFCLDYIKRFKQGLLL